MKATRNQKLMLVGIGLCFAALVHYWPEPKLSPPGQNPENIARDRAQAEADAQLLIRCTTGLPQVMEQAQAQIRSGDPEAAYVTMEACQQHLNDGPGKALYFSSLAAREGKIDKDQKAKAKKEKVFADLVEKAAKAEHRRNPPAIGMTMAQTLESAWGKPERTNWTETKFGHSSQWIYGRGRYVYFEGDRLTAIQQ